jgi:rubrerythrin
MAKFQCTICGHIHEGLEAPEKCPVCKAPSSKFTVIDKGAQKATKLQKINEEDYEIIKKLETDGYVKAVEWYKENYDCELDEAKETVKAIWAKYKVSYPGSDLDEIREMLESAKSVSGAVKLYKEKYNVSSDEANSKVLEAVRKFNTENSEGKSSSGCMVTILIAITSTLSVLWLI